MSMSRAAFGQVMAVMCASCQRPLTDELVASWWPMFDDLTAEQFQRGVIAAIRQQEYQGFPPIGTIRKLALAGQQTGTDDDRANQAFGQALRAIRLGSYVTVEFADDATAATIMTLYGGWPEWCGLSEQELRRYVQPRFLATYRSYLATGVPAEMAGPLLGLVDRENIKNEYSAMRPKRIESLLPGQPARLIGERRKPQWASLPSPAVAELGEKLKRADPLPGSERQKPKLLTWAPGEDVPLEAAAVIDQQAARRERQQQKLRQCIADRKLVQSIEAERQPEEVSDA